MLVINTSASLRRFVFHQLCFVTGEGENAPHTALLPTLIFINIRKFNSSEQFFPSRVPQNVPCNIERISVPQLAVSGLSLCATILLLGFSTHKHFYRYRLIGNLKFTLRAFSWNKVGKYYTLS